MIRISDARMSGTAFGTIVLHVSPEANVGGPISIVETYGANTVYRVINNRLDRVAVQRVGEYDNGDQGSWVLVTGDAIKEGDAVLSHQLPGAVDGLKVAFAPTGD